MSRSQNRQSWDPAIRIQLAEGDLDALEQRVDEWEDRLDSRIEKLDERLAANTKTLIGILVAVATTGVLLGINVWLVMAR